MTELNNKECQVKYNRIKEKYELKERLQKRKENLNRSFRWTDENVQKIIALNNGLLERYRQMYDEMARVRNEYEERYAKGDNNYKDYTIELEVWYSADDNMSEDEAELWGDLCEETIDWGPHLSCGSNCRGQELDSFEKMMFLDVHSCNLEPPFHVKELEGVMLYYFMHEIFDHNDTYSLEDAVHMKPENFHWQLVICLEHWD